MSRSVSPVSVSSASSPRRLSIRWMLDGSEITRTSALLRSQAQRAQEFKVGSSRKRLARSSLSSSSTTATTVASPHVSSRSPTPRAVSSLYQTSSPVSSTSGIDFQRSIPLHPDVVPIKAEDARIKMSSVDQMNNIDEDETLAASRLPAGSNATTVNGVTSGSAAVVTASVPVIPGTMMNISDARSAALNDPNQFPYSGPVLSAARLKPSFPIIIPHTATWFDSSTIHPIEKRAFPELLEITNTRGGITRSKGMNWYREIRDAIIAAYRANPRIYLTITACRRQIAGDVGLISRIHKFLEQWGLINYHVDPGSQPLMGYTNKEKNTYPILTHTPNPYVYPSTTAESTATSKTPSLHHLYDFSAVPAASAGAPLIAQRRNILVGPVAAQDVLAKDQTYSLAPGESHYCKNCHAECESLRYVARQDRSIVLCPNCFAAGHFPPLLIASDFDRIATTARASSSIASASSPANTTGNEWKREETLKLLDALATYGDNWEAVSEAVHRSKEDCCLHFLSLPIEDPFLEQYYHNTTSTTNTKSPPAAQNGVHHKDKSAREIDGDVSMAGTSSSSSTSVAAPTSDAAKNGPTLSSNRPLPFADAGNPILAQIAFLASTVSPAVASAAAQATIEYYTRNRTESKSQLKGEGDHLERNGHTTTTTTTTTPTETTPSTSTLTNQDEKMDISEDGQEGNRVQTAFGEGELVPSLRSDGIVQVKLPWAILYTQQEQIQTPSSSTTLTALSSSSSSSSSSSTSTKKKHRIWTDKELSILAQAPISASTTSTVSLLCLSAAALKARELSDEEERKILRLVAQIVQHQMNKIELKLGHLEELDKFIQHQTTHIIQQQYQQLYRERMELYEQQQQQQQAASSSSFTQPYPNPADNKQGEVTAAVPVHATPVAAVIAPSSASSSHLQAASVVR